MMEVRLSIKKAKSRVSSQILDSLDYPISKQVYIIYGYQSFII